MFNVVTIIGKEKMIATSVEAINEARKIAEALTDGAKSNPRNPTPLHWVEEV